MRLIDADALIKYIIDDNDGYILSDRLSVIDIENYIDDAPTIDTPQAVHAYWKLDPNGMDWGIPAWTCSHCGGRNDMIPPFIFTKHGGYVPKNPNVFAGSNYCPNCGARMDEDNE